VDGKEYYSDENGFSGHVSKSKKARRKLAGSSVPSGKPVPEAGGYLRIHSNQLHPYQK
jgi:hypothetical protein